MTSRNGAHCSRHQHYTVTGDAGYISSGGPGGGEIGFPCPWRLRVLPGQKLNITLYDFSRTSRGTSSSPSNLYSTCKRYATIQEQPRRQETPVCGGSKRIRSVYISDGHQVDLRLTDFTHTSRDQTDPVNFLVKYSAIGCPHVTSPKNSHVVYTGNSMIVTCNTTKEKWYLTCQKNQWVGSIANCSARK